MSVYRYANGFYKGNNIKQFLIVILSVVKIAISTIIPLVYSQVINYLVSNEVESIWGLFIVLMIMYVLNILFSFLIGKIEATLTRDINFAVRKSISNQLYSLPTYKLQGYSNGKIHALIVQDTLSVSSIINTIRSSVLTFITLVFTGVAAFAINWKLSLILISTYPITYLVNSVFSKKIKTNSNKLTQANDSMLSYVRNNTENLADIKMQNGKQKTIAKFYDIAEENKNLALHQVMLSTINASFVSVISFVNYAVLTAFEIAFVISGVLLIGTFVAFNSYSKNLSNSLDSLVQLGSRLQPTIVSIKRLLEVEKLFNETATEEQLKADFDEKIESIIFDDVTLKIGNKVVLENFACKIKPGIIGIKGTNGAGKTSILNMVLRNLLPSRGTIRINDRSLDSIKYQDIQRHFSFVGANKIIYNLSILDNLTLFDDKEIASKSAIEDVLKCVNLENDIKALQNKLDTIISDTERLSSGQIQKIQIARVFLKDSNVVILDEAFSSLDADTRDIIKKYLLSHCINKIIIIVSHNPEDYDICQQVISLG